MIKLHHCHQTRSMRVLWLLHELDIPFELIAHSFDQSLRAPEFLSHSPVGRVPSLEMEGETMFESLAILQYLTAKYPAAELGRSIDDPDFAEWLTWLNFGETLTQHTAALTQQHIALYDDTMRSPVVMKLEAARIGKCYDALERRLSTPVENRDYLLTSGFSAADISVGQSVYMARHFVKLDNHPETARWYDRLAERPAFQASLPPEGADLLYNEEFYPPWTAS